MHEEEGLLSDGNGGGEGEGDGEGNGEREDKTFNEEFKELVNPNGKEVPEPLTRMLRRSVRGSGSSLPLGFMRALNFSWNLSSSRSPLTSPLPSTSPPPLPSDKSPRFFSTSINE